MNLFILTGEREAGKTTFCRDLYHRALMKKWQVTGLITLTRRKEKLTALDLYSGESCLLAEVNRGHEGDLHTGLWSFHTQAVIWGNRKISTPPPSDLFILDEAGILEFKRDGGWTEGMKRLDSRRDRVSVVVIRPELINAASERWREAEVIRIDSHDPETRKILMKQILKKGLL